MRCILKREPGRVFFIGRLETNTPIRTSIDEILEEKNIKTDWEALSLFLYFCEDINTYDKHEVNTMIISKAQVQNIMNIYNKDANSGRVDKTAGVRGAARKDELSISSESRIMQKAMQAAKEAPDIRWDRVKEVQEKMKTNPVSDNEIAEKLLQRVIVDELI